MGRTADSTLANLKQTNDRLQRQLAERTAEREGSEGQKVALAEVLGVINASPDDLASVFDAILDRAIGLCGADAGHILTFDGQLFRPVAVKGIPRLVEMIERLGARPP